MTLQQKIDVMTAFRDGAKIQFRRKTTSLVEPWNDAANWNEWDFSSWDFRVKPEPWEGVLEYIGPSLDEAMVYNYRLTGNGVKNLPQKIRVREVL